MDCGVYASNLSFIRMAGDDDVGYSHESEHDLAVMVSDFLENGSGDSHRYLNSSDSDSGFSDLPSLADNIKCYKLSMDQYERDLLSVVDSLMQSISEIDLHLVKPGPCNASCIRFSLVKLLRLSGYDAAVCAAKWQGSGKVPGVVYVGSLGKLKQYLQVMVEAARSSLKQNSMPFPPWRSLPVEEKLKIPARSNHKQCYGNLKRLQASIQSEMEVQRLLKPRNSDKSRILKLERRRLISYKTL